MYVQAFMPFLILTSLNGLIVYRLSTTSSERRKSLFDAGAELTAVGLYYFAWIKPDKKTDNFRDVNLNVD